jgi:hypothetical protein
MSDPHTMSNPHTNGRGYLMAYQVKGTDDWLVVYDNSIALLPDASSGDLWVVLHTGTRKLKAFESERAARAGALEAAESDDETDHWWK